MGKLIFIGLGLGDERGITLKGLEVARTCDSVFMETYTSTLSSGSIERLEKLLGKDINMLDRQGVEGGEIILEKAETGTTCLLVPGDPMSATTHLDMRLRAHEANIETQVIDGVSALIAVPAALGLQIYKFGKTLTIPIPQPNFNPTSFYEKALDNFRLSQQEKDVSRQLKEAEGEPGAPTKPARPTKPPRSYAGDYRWRELVETAVASRQRYEFERARRTDKHPEVIRLKKVAETAEALVRKREAELDEEWRKKQANLPEAEQMASIDPQRATLLKELATLRWECTEPGQRRSGRD